MQVSIIISAGFLSQSRRDELTNRSLNTAISVNFADCIRAQILMETELGREIKNYLDLGELLPNELCTMLCRTMIQQAEPHDHVLLFGYPREIPQFTELIELFSKQGWNLDQIIHVNPNFDPISILGAAYIDKFGSSDVEKYWIERIGDRERKLAPLRNYLREFYPEIYTEINL